jgi:FkbM family methyltransferase
MVQQYYSQHGEDALLLQVFDKPGYFVELGAVDGVHLSNTYALEQAGWSGLLVEAVPALFEKVLQNRPKATSIHAAVADTDGELTFYGTEVGSLSTFDKEQRDYFIKNRTEVTADSYTSHKIRSATTASLLKEANAPKVIDVMSVDIEGAELVALNGLDFDAYDVRCLIIEKDFARAKAANERTIEDLVKSKGYIFGRRIGPNDFWVKEPELAKALDGAHIKAVLPTGPVDIPAGRNSKKRGLFKRLSDSIKKRLG